MRTRGAGLRKLLLWAAVAAAVAWTLFPLYVAAMTSIKPDSVGLPMVWLPYVDFRPTAAHWRWEWRERWNVDGIATAWKSTVIVAAVSALAAVLVGLLAAVGLLRFRRGPLPVAVLVGLFVLPRAVPSVALVAPFASLLQEAHLRDTHAGLILAHVMLALPLAILLLDSAVREVPADLIDAAQLDGATWPRATWQVIAPLVAPMVAGAAVLTFALSWNEFVFALTNHGARVTTATVAVALMEEPDGIPFAHVGSHLVLIVGPPLLLALGTQRFLVRGLTLGAVRG
ncbi:MAG: carbohydrate ABC transporter permease [Thermomicrobiales bacterium]